MKNSIVHSNQSEDLDAAVEVGAELLALVLIAFVSYQLICFAYKAAPGLFSNAGEIVVGAAAAFR